MHTDVAAEKLAFLHRIPKFRFKILTWRPDILMRFLAVPRVRPNNCLKNVFKYAINLNLTIPTLIILFNATKTEQLIKHC
jgi:hypothetical protein